MTIANVWQVNIKPVQVDGVTKYVGWFKYCAGEGKAMNTWRTSLMSPAKWARGTRVEAHDLVFSKLEEKYNKYHPAGIKLRNRHDELLNDMEQNLFTMPAKTEPQPAKEEAPAIAEEPAATPQPSASVLLNNESDRTQNNDIQQETKPAQPPKCVATQNGASKVTSKPKKELKSKPRKDKQEQEKYYPSFVPIVTEFFNIPLKSNKKKTSSQFVDAYIFGLVQYCSQQLGDKCCYFSATTIAEKIHVTRQTVMMSIEKLVLNELIIKKDRPGKPPVLTLANLSEIPTCEKFQHVRNSNNTCKNFLHVKALTCQNFLHRKEYIDKEKENAGKAANANYRGSGSSLENLNAESEEHGGDMFDEKLKNCIELWRDGTGRDITPFQSQQLDSLITDYSYEWTMHALQEMFKQNPSKYSMNYLNGILNRWHDSGLSKPWEKQGPAPSPIQHEHERHEETEEERAKRNKEVANVLDF